jgi:MoaA/NifB/PqqE/SkfB family radical SAM enzyme
MSYSDTIKRSWNGNHLMSVLLELTYACNLDCSFCYNDLSLEGQKLSLAQYRELLGDLASLSALSLTLSGGEPLAHPHFYEIAGYARQQGFVLRLKSNGHALAENVARRIRDEVDPFIIEVSLHGAQPATHDRQTRVPGSFERLVGNIRTMKTLGLRVKANSVLTIWNENEVEAMLALCDTLEVPLQIDPEVKPRDDGDTSPLGIAASTAGLASYKHALARQNKSDETATEPLDSLVASARRETMNGTDKHCGAGSNNLTVDPYGNVLPCVQWRVPVGNLHDRRVTEIWADSVRLREVRQTTKAARRMLEELGDPGLLANFCPGAAHTYSGDPLAIYPAAQQRIDSGRARVRLPVL